MDEPVLDRLDAPETSNGQQSEPLTHTFVYDGHDDLTLTLNDHISSITLLQLGAVVGMGEEAGNEFVAVMWEALSDTLASGELRRFKDWCKQTDPAMDELVEMIGELIAKVTGRPFEERQTSQAGPPETPTGSTVPGDAEPETPAGQVSAL